MIKKLILVLTFASALARGVEVVDRPEVFENARVPQSAQRQRAAINAFLQASQTQPTPGHLWVFHLTEGDKPGSYDVFVLADLDLSAPGRVTKNTGGAALAVSADLVVKAVKPKFVEVDGRLDITAGKLAWRKGPLEGKIPRLAFYSLGGAVDPYHPSPRENVFAVVLF
jgi:hypothetical protein